MITEDLKRNLVDYLQLVQDIAREIPAQRGTNLLTQYYALKGITNGLRAAIQGLADLQRLYAPDKISFKLLPLSETLEDYHGIARTATIDTIRAIERVLASEMRQLEEQDGKTQLTANSAITASL